ncbi:MAG: ribosomal protein [Bacteroidetes bacterium]|nr:ribosomal protein [Bacteroidota bacterium]
MAVKIRLQRHGKKGQPFYHIVIADGRAPRDGRFIERIGSYNPVSQPATIDLDIDSACKWLKNGAQPTDTARAILSYKGVLLKRHLQIGVEKGAITQEVADAKFNAWLTEKENKISSAKEAKRNNAKADAKKTLAAEMEFNAKRAEAISKKRAEAEAAANPVVEEVPAEETPEVEEVVVETTEAPAAE